MHPWPDECPIVILWIKISTSHTTFQPRGDCVWQNMVFPKCNSFWKQQQNFECLLIYKEYIILKHDSRSNKCVISWMRILQNHRINKPPSDVQTTATLRPQVSREWNACSWSPKQISSVDLHGATTIFCNRNLL